MKRKIAIDKNGYKSTGIWGYAGEQNITDVEITLPDELVPCDFCIAIITNAGRMELTDKLEIINGKVNVIVPLSCTAAGKITVQIVSYVMDEAEEIYAIGKTAEFEGKIKPSATGKKIADDVHVQLLERIWAKIQAWADKMHTHENYNTLDYFSCNALDNPITDGDFNIGINTEDWNRLKFRGDTILFASDGAVVRNVEVKEDDSGKKFFRMHFNKPGLDISPEPMTSFVDIPINDTNDKVEIGLNGSGLELELPTGGVSRADMELYVTAAINGSLDEIETMIDESGVLDE